MSLGCKLVYISSHYPTAMAILRITKCQYSVATPISIPLMLNNITQAERILVLNLKYIRIKVLALLVKTDIM